MGTVHPGWQIALAVVFLAAFVAAEFVVLVFEVRRQAFAASIIELPLLLGLFFLSPALLVLARASAALIARAYQRQVKIKLWFNVASLAAGAACATLIVRAGPPLVGTDPVTWLLLAAAVGVNIVVTFGAVAGVVSLVQGRVSGSQLAQMVLPSLPVAAANVALALVVLVLLKQTPWALILLAALAAIFVVSYRFYARSIRQSRALAEMYRPHPGTGGHPPRRHPRRRAAGPGAGDAPSRVRHAVAAGPRPASGGAALRPGGRPRRCWMSPPPRRPCGMRAFDHRRDGRGRPPPGGRGPAHAMLRESGAKDAVVVPLRAGSAVIGCAGGGRAAGRLHPFQRRRCATAGDDRGARRGGGGELPPGRPAPIRRLPRRAHRPAQPSPGQQRSGGVRGGAAARRGGRGAAVRRRRAAGGQRVAGPRRRRPVAGAAG